MTLPRTLAAALAAAVLVTAPAAAYADTVTHADPRGDVVSANGLTDDETTTPAPSRSNGDVVSTRITHGAGAVKIKIRHRDLVRKGSVYTVVPIRSDKGSRYLTLTVRPGLYAGRAELTKNDDQDKVACKGLTRQVDYVRNTTLLTVPRSCLGNPTWVRVGVGVVSTDNGFRTVYGDDARTTGTIGTDDPVLSPRIYR